MRLKSILVAFAFLSCNGVCAQSVSKAEFDKLAGKVATLSSQVTQMETNLNRVLTENANLVKQLKLETLTSVTDENNVQWDIVRVEPEDSGNDVVITFRVTNHSDDSKHVGFGFNLGSAVDSDSNLGNNVYVIKDAYENPSLSSLAPKTPVNIRGYIKDVPKTSSYLAVITLGYSPSERGFSECFVKFTGVHIPR